jgi:hypothetical protein
MFLKWFLTDHHFYEQILKQKCNYPGSQQGLRIIEMISPLTHGWRTKLLLTLSVPVIGKG